ncbi:GAF domain-containing protein [Hydrogenophaga sp.]|uniref:GAF domain-containing protein n=1 Tax=Hydrogenophaga sp. TaxID=1904254 RepID=UPI002717C688|nr:GAF domain-containing protein [Hydrogenophaga sp.]MDO9437788.1 GAF domain-containing protein [Hydrogenophaga sp.]
MNTHRLEQLRSELLDNGIDGCLKLLNQSVEHRYTAVYRLRDATLTNVGLYDKVGEVKPEYLAEVPLETSFCQFVLRDGLFLTGDSSLDTRLEGHPYKGVMMAYHGVPVKSAQGDLYGTLCHFDLVQRPLSDEEFELLQEASILLAPFVAREQTG